MAKTITPLDASTIVSAIYEQAKGEQLTATDLEDFVSVGESILNTGFENVANALTIVFARTVVPSRAYKAKIYSIQETDTGLYSNRLRKISFYDKGVKSPGFVNTDTKTNFYDGYDNTKNGGASVGTMWEQDMPVAVEMHFGGSNAFDIEMTYVPDQLKAAFTSPDEFAQFWNGYMVNKQNEIEQLKEDKNRLTLLNYMAGLYDMGMAIDLVADFNSIYGTSYTGSDLRTTHAAEFLAYLVAKIDKLSEYMTDRSYNYHWSPTVSRYGQTYDKIARFTPKEDQKLILLNDFMFDAKTKVLPQIFHDGALKIENYEGVNYWQSNTDAGRAGISITPNIPDTTTPFDATHPAQTKGNAVALDYVVGVLFDRDACITNYQFDKTLTTPVEARKNYQNSWIHNMFNSINDFTENGILLYMAS